MTRALFAVCRVIVTAVLAVASFFLGGCGERDDVILYTSIDAQHARAVVDRFERETGLRVRVVSDTEATRSVGLAQRIRAEAARPQADVFWGNEVFHTIALADEGLFAPRRAASADDVPAGFRDADDRWVSCGVRLRVLAVRHDLPEDQTPTRLEDLVDERFRGRVAVARPTAGTTGGHVAALYVRWGTDRADDYFRALHANGVAVVASNSVTAQQVGGGNYDAAFTDNDDIVNVRESGSPVRQVVPDQGDGEMGTLAIPTTVARVADRPANAAADRLYDFLASAGNEQALIDAGFAASSVREEGRGGSGVETMDVDYAEVARMMPEAVRRSLALLDGREP